MADGRWSMVNGNDSAAGSPRFGRPPFTIHHYPLPHPASYFSGSPTPDRPMRRALPFVLVTALAACADAGGDANQPTVTDSAGIAIVQHGAQAWERAPMWALSAEPLAVIGGDPNDTTIDLSNSQVGTILDDGRIIAASMEPPQMYVFAADGSSQRPLGRGGEGPGEYRFLSALLPLGGDTLAAYDLFTRRAMMFDIDGEALEPVQFPMSGSMIPPLLSARLNGNVWLFQLINPMAEPPSDASGIYRVDAPVFTWRDGQEALDTLFMVKGPSLVKGVFEMGGQSIQMGRAAGYGANSFVGGHGDVIWSTSGEQFTLTARDTSGAVRREVRLGMAPRVVSESDKEAFKEALRAQWEFARSMGAPPQFIEAELAKVDETEFAVNRPAIGLMVVDRLGRVWVTPDAPQVDSTLTYGVFSPEGNLLGKVQLPKGSLFAANADRVVVRREDEETGLVRLEVWGLQQDQ